MYSRAPEKKSSLFLLPEFCYNQIMKLRKYTKDDIQGKRVLVRCDLDIKVNKQGIVDKYHDLRLERMVSAIHELFGYGAKQIILLGHRGRPRGKDQSLSLSPVRDRLADLCLSEGLDEPIAFIDDIFISEKAYAEDSIIMLENLRFWEGEKANNEQFAIKLAQLGDAYVNNAFGNSHRQDASMSALPRVLGKTFAGENLQKEVQQLESFIESINPPFILVLGGAKISTKLPLIKALLDKADFILLGGGLANTVLSAHGKEVGKSLVEEEMLSNARDLCGDKIILPSDAFVDEHKAISVDEIGREQSILDIGDESIKKFVQLIQEANTILWNGPMGKFEDKIF